MPKFYITTAIDYSNGDPHLGHALEKVGADCIARYRRLLGDDVRFLMGMDEHSQSVIQVAASAGVTPSAWVERMAATFAGYWRRLQCSHDDWIRTTEPRHVRSVTALLRRIAERHPADLFVADYEGLYCTGCEEFKQEAQIVNGRCIEHPTLELVPTKERNHFFRLSAYRDRLLDLIRSGRFAIEPAIRRNEVVRLLESGLQDISISRVRLSWGIPFPGDEEQTVYVWFDALINYLSATGFPDAGFERWWPADLHVIGKGITRFHCIIWPAMLLAADLALPRMVWAHGYVQWEGTKMSKTAGTAVSLDTAIERHGADALRYFLLREVGFENDGDFTWERFDARYTAELADTLGNLASRVLQMIRKYRSGKVAAGRTERSGPRHELSGTPLEAALKESLASYRRAMDGYALSEGAAAMIGLAARANRYVQETAPWELASRRDEAQLDLVLAGLVRALACVAVMALPFIPTKAEALWRALGAEAPLAGLRLTNLDVSDVPHWRVTDVPILFPKPQAAIR